MQMRKKLYIFKYLAKVQSYFLPKSVILPLIPIKFAILKPPWQIWGQLAYAMPARRPQMKEKPYCFEKPVGGIF
jgi:hypothetical protein